MADDHLAGEHSSHVTVRRSDTAPESAIASNNGVHGPVFRATSADRVFYQEFSRDVCLIAGAKTWLLHKEVLYRKCGRLRQLISECDTGLTVPVVHLPTDIENGDPTLEQWGWSLYSLYTFEASPELAGLLVVDRTAFLAAWRFFEVSMFLRQGKLILLATNTLLDLLAIKARQIQQDNDGVETSGGGRLPLQDHFLDQFFTIVQDVGSQDPFYLRVRDILVEFIAMTRFGVMQDEGFSSRVYSQPDFAAQVLKRQYDDEPGALMSYDAPNSCHRCNMVCHDRSRIVFQQGPSFDHLRRSEPRTLYLQGLCTGCDPNNIITSFVDRSEGGAMARVRMRMLTNTRRL